MATAKGGELDGGESVVVLETLAPAAALQSVHHLRHRAMSNPSLGEPNRTRASGTVAMACNPATRHYVTDYS
jgi:hypothetical protein